MPDTPVSDHARQITGHFDTNIRVFFKLLIPVLPFLILYNMGDFIADDAAWPADIVFKALQYYGSAMLAYHWIAYCVTGRAPASCFYPFMPDKNFLLFLLTIIVFRLSMQADTAIFYLLKSNHTFIANFWWIRYLLIALYVGVVYGVYRLSFLLPMIASGEKLQLASSWQATRHDPYEIIFSGARAALPYILAVILIPAVMNDAVHLIFDPGQESLAAVFRMIFNLPVTVFLTPIILALSVGALTYHYKTRLVLSHP